MPTKHGDGAWRGGLLCRAICRNGTDAHGSEQNTGDESLTRHEDPWSPAKTLHYWNRTKVRQISILEIKNQKKKKKGISCSTTYTTGNNFLTHLSLSNVQNFFIEENQVFRHKLVCMYNFHTRP